MKKVLIMVVLFVVILSGCGTTDSEEGWSGDWIITMFGTTKTANISTGKNSMVFLSNSYNGSYSGNNFKGTRSIKTSNSTTDATLNINRSGDKISGSLNVVTSSGGYTNRSTNSFSGYRK